MIYELAVLIMTFQQAVAPVLQNGYQFDLGLTTHIRYFIANSRGGEIMHKVQAELCQGLAFFLTNLKLTIHPKYFFNLEKKVIIRDTVDWGVSSFFPLLCSSCLELAAK